MELSKTSSAAKPFLTRSPHSGAGLPITSYKGGGLNIFTYRHLLWLEKLKKHSGIIGLSDYQEILTIFADIGMMTMEK